MIPSCNTSNTRILVTGSTGYIGQPLCQALCEQGYEVHRLQSRLIPGEVSSECCGMDVVIHCAAELKNRPKMYGTNVVGTKTLAAAAAMRGVKRFLYLSTASTRDTEYVRTKQKGERIVTSYGDQMRVTILKIPTLYGGRRGPKWLQGLKLWLQRRPINLQSREDAVRDIVRAVETA